MSSSLFSEEIYVMSKTFFVKLVTVFLIEVVCFRVPDLDWPTVSDGGYLVINTTVSTMSVTMFESRYYDFWASMSQNQSSTLSAI